MAAKFQPTRPLRGATWDGACAVEQLAQISTHAPLAGRDHGCCPTSGRSLVFQPTRPLRGATTVLALDVPDRQMISTHAPLAGRDHSRRPRRGGRSYFNPRAPCGARPGGSIRCRQSQTYFNPRAPCGARLGSVEFAEPVRRISTHAPLAGRDHRHRRKGLLVAVISTHAPLAGRDRSARAALAAGLGFQPTRPLRGATVLRDVARHRHIGISTHAPLAGRDHRKPRLFAEVKISTHAPLAGRDKSLHRLKIDAALIFQPTRPLRGATT